MGALTVNAKCNKNASKQLELLTLNHLKLLKYKPNDFQNLPKKFQRLRSLAPSISPRLPGTKLTFELGALPVFETRRRFCLKTFERLRSVAAIFADPFMCLNLTTPIMKAQ